MKWNRISMVWFLIFCFMSGAAAGRSISLGAVQQGQADEEVQDRTDEDEQVKQAAADSGAFLLVIDNKNVYKGMAQSYSRGYTPKTDGTKAVVVLPLLSKRQLLGGKLTAALQWGESGNSPFVLKNYEKTVKYGVHRIGKMEQGVKSRKKTGCYLVSFNLELKKKRYNGTYPVTVSVNAEDKGGNEINQEFTVYVTITDGKRTGENGDSQRGDSGQRSSMTPKIRIESYRFSKKKILCGEKAAVKISLLNTSKTAVVKNMLVTVAPDENVELLGETNSAYVEELGTGKTCLVCFDFRVNASAPGGQYGIGVTLDYADRKGTSYNMEETVKVSAEQKVRIGIDPVQVPKEIQLGDTVVLQTQAMNLGKGKLYNVRAILEAEGLASVRSAYMGDAEAGTSLAGSLEVAAEGLSGDSLYGSTQGKVIFYYEDETGHEMKEEQIFETAISSPLKKDDNKKPVDNTGQWWVIMAVITTVLGLVIVVIFTRKHRVAKMEERDLDEK